MWLVKAVMPLQGGVELRLLINLICLHIISITLPDEQSTYFNST